MKRSIPVLMALFLTAQSAGAALTCKTPATGPRTVVVISDLHFGAGMAANVALFEDFRWPRALKAFLDQLNVEFGPNVDLVIAGDLFEFWQHPTVQCADSKGNLGCSAVDIGNVAAAAIGAHSAELKSIGEFAVRPGNHVYIVPGNHDAALMLDDVWQKVARAIGDTNVTRVSDGRWFSADCRVAVEHGQQIGEDVNRFPDWPRVTAVKDSREYVWKPWGEAFVADQFNHIEQDYPLIDNVLPVTAGLKMYLDEHTVPHNARDIASFITFNIFRTSLKQKIALNVYTDSSPTTTWDAGKARGLGYRLVASAMPDDDPDRDKLLKSSDDTWKDTRQLLTERLSDRGESSDEDVATLCDLAAEYAHQHAIDSSSPAERVQCSLTLMVGAATALIPEKRVLASYVSDIQKAQPKVRYFIYGHTHKWVSPFPVRLKSGISAMVLNDGAFQRVVSMDTLLAAYARRHKSDAGSVEKSSALKMSLDELPPCYSLAVVSYDKGLPIPEIRMWVFGENFRSGKLYRAEALGSICNLK